MAAVSGSEVHEPNGQRPPSWLPSLFVALLSLSLSADTHLWLPLTPLVKGGGAPTKSDGHQAEAREEDCVLFSQADSSPSRLLVAGHHGGGWQQLPSPLASTLAMTNPWVSQNPTAFLINPGNTRENFTSTLLESLATIRTSLEARLAPMILLYFLIRKSPILSAGIEEIVMKQSFENETEKKSIMFF